MNYKKVFESWELEDRAAQPKEYGNRRKASDKRYYKRMASKAVRRHNALVISAALVEEDSFEDLLALKAMLMAKRDMLLEKVDEVEAILNALPI
jgi:hypothetical protein